jgi:chromate transporter
LPRPENGAPFGHFCVASHRRDAPICRKGRQFDEFVWTFLGQAISRSCPYNFVIFHMNNDVSSDEPRISLPSLMVLFLHIGLTSFGGSTMAWMHRELVERRKLLDDHSFMTGLTISQILPGANPVNLAIYLGGQVRGRVGAAVAVFGIVFPAFCVILFMGFLYRTYAEYELTHVVLGGVAAAGVGATLAMGVKLANRVMIQLIPTAIAIFTFVVIGVLRWPLVPVVSALVPFSILQAYLVQRRRNKDG